jgi:hypothetical protein
MFSNLLHKSIQVGEKIFHILSDVNISPDEIEKFGVEVIKVAGDLRVKIKELQEKQAQEAVKPVEAPPEAEKPAE